MSKKDQVPDIESVLAERARVEAWLEQLAAKAATMPAHVVERVRLDYSDRLTKVVADLRSRGDALEAQAGVLEERLGTLEGELAAKRDARAEDELRALVGEYDEEAWREKAGEHDRIIGKLEGELAERASEHSRARELLAEATRAPRASAPIEPEASDAAIAAVGDAADGAAPAPIAAGAPDVPPPSPAVEPVAPVAQQPPAAASQVPKGRPSAPITPPAASPAQHGTAKRPSPFDEIGFLRTVVGRVTPFPKVDGPPAQPQQPAANAVAEKAEAPRVERRSAERASIPSFEAPPIPDVPATTPARASSPAVPAFTDDPPAETELLSPVRTSGGSDDAARSLKCQECGWMNYPTEWYCEKCGGELAAF